MKWRFGAALALLAIAAFCIFIFVLPALSGVGSIVLVPKRRPLAFAGLILLIIWMYLYEKHRARKPDRKIIYAIISKGKILIPKRIVLRREAKRLRRVGNGSDESNSQRE